MTCGARLAQSACPRAGGGIRERERGHACYIHHFSLFKWEYVEQVVTLKKVILHTEMLPGFTVLEWWAYSSRGSA